MAMEIGAIPALKGKGAEYSAKAANKAYKNQNKQDFSKHVSEACAALEKTKMLQNMGFLFEKCTFAVLDEYTIKECDPFSCGHQDLDDFFHNDAPFYNAQLLEKSYCLRPDKKPSDIACASTVSNGSVRVSILPNNREKKVQRAISHTRQIHHYPGILAGRLGINKEYKYQGIGSDLMTFIKSWFIDTGNKIGCRFLIVDAYNENIPLNYYLRSGFKCPSSTEAQEVGYTDFETGTHLKTRLMYFDLTDIILYPNNSSKDLVNGSY